MEFLDLPKRTQKQRSYGITSIADFGIPLGQLHDLLNDYSEFVDIAKIAIGTAYVAPNLQKKIELYKSFNIKPYFGGTLFEKFYYQNKMTEYVQLLNKFDIDTIEISTGTLEIPLNERLHLISELKNHFTCIAEVGSKDSNVNMSINEWMLEMKSLLSAGCQYVITEGRDSGTSGIYEKSGNIKSNLINELISDLDTKRIIFEAPTSKSQMYFINEIGPNVNLGNIKPSDILTLEAERVGLRSETFFMEELQWK